YSLLLLLLYRDGFAEKFYARQAGAKIVVHICRNPRSFLLDRLLTLQNCLLPFKFPMIIRPDHKHEHSEQRKPHSNWEPPRFPPPRVNNDEAINLSAQPESVAACRSNEHVMTPRRQIRKGKRANIARRDPFTVIYTIGILYFARIAIIEGGKLYHNLPGTGFKFYNRGPFSLNWEIILVCRAEACKGQVR